MGALPTTNLVVEHIGPGLITRGYRTMVQAAVSFWTVHIPFGILGAPRKSD